jgi:hypothetical protein
VQSDSNNPPGNILGAGVTERDLQNAIELSGYPLQSIASDVILSVLEGDDRNCYAQEEWSFIDSDENIVRQLDGLITCEFIGKQVETRDPPLDPSSYLRFQADILMECKQSDMPYVFFSGTAVLALYHVWPVCPLKTSNLRSPVLESTKTPL